MPNNFMNAEKGGKLVARSIMKASREAAKKAGYKDEDVLLKAYANSSGVMEPFELNLEKNRNKR